MRHWRACLPDWDGCPRGRVGLSMKPSPVGLNAHLPPHLREVCDILAAGLVRLCSRNASDIERDHQIEGGGSLHFPPDQSMCANRNNRRAA